jgi:hypothetical protein
VVQLLDTFLQFFISSAPKTELQSEIESVHLKVYLLLLSLLNMGDLNSTNRGHWFSEDSVSNDVYDHVMLKFFNLKKKSTLLLNKFISHS